MLKKDCDFSIESFQLVAYSFFIIREGSLQSMRVDALDVSQNLSGYIDKIILIYESKLK